MAGPKAQILVVEDDLQMQTLICGALQAEGHQLHAVTTGEAALAHMAASAPNLIILDLQLAGRLTGFDVLAATRQRNQDTRVIILTQLPGEERTIRGLELGADDYLAKGLSTQHLLARVRAQLRRTPVGSRQTYRCGAATIDLQTNTLVVGDRRWALGQVERQVLARLIQDAGQVVATRDLVRAGWHYELPEVMCESDTHILRGIMYNLRKKMGDVIVTHRGIGFSLALPIAEGEEVMPPL